MGVAICKNFILTVTQTCFVVSKFVAAGNNLRMRSCDKTMNNFLIILDNEPLLAASGILLSLNILELLCIMVGHVGKCWEEVLTFSEANSFYWGKHLSICACGSRLIRTPAKVVE